MKKQSKSARIENALAELEKRKILDHWAKFEKESVWEVSFDGGRNFNGVSLLDFSIKDVDFKHIQKCENDLTAVIAAMAFSIDKIHTATCEKLDKFYEKVKNK